MGQCNSSGDPLAGVPNSAPVLYYCPIAGRAELIRLIAAAGGLEITEKSEMAAFGNKMLPSTGESKTEYYSITGMPLLCHGDMKMSQSGAIETYIASIAPRYVALTTQQRAIDNMFQGIKEEILFNCAKAIFTTRKADEAQAKKDVTELFDKWFSIFEEKLPNSGFILNLGFPTPADLAVLNITVGFMPFGAAKKLAGYDFDKWAKVKGFCDRVAAHDRVAAYLKSSTYTAANPMGM